MNSLSTPHHSRYPLSWLLPATLCLVVSAVAVSNQSFWIDEGYNAWKARQPTLAQWWQQMIAHRGSDLQMPLYMIFSWAWEKIGGHSEWWLRAANIPWLLLGVLGWGKRWELVALLSPFVWYYMDEARPYAMQIGTSMLIFGSLIRLYRSDAEKGERSNVLWLGVGLVCLSGSSLLGMIWAGAAILTIAIMWPWIKVWQLVKRNWISCLSVLISFCILAIYYLYTLKVGGGASQANVTGAKNLVYIFYELAGFSGVGPGRLEIRTGGLGAFRPYLLPLLAYGTPVAVLSVVGIREALRTLPRRILISLAIALGGTILFLIMAGVLKHFRILGRHFTPLLPVILGSLVLGACTLWKGKSRFGQVMVGWFLIASLASSLSVRFAVRHAKDDYRAAAALARESLQRGQIVWWSADATTAEFYGVRMSSSASEVSSNIALLVVNPNQDDLKRLPVPELVVLSKADLYDGQGALREFLAVSGYHLAETLPAFAVWRRDGML